MGLRKRGKIWHCEWQIGGRRVAETTGTTDREAAQEYHDRIKAELWRQQKLGDRPQYTWNAAVLRWLAERHAKKTEADLPPGARLVEASERLRTAFEPDDWVQVPDSKIPGTQVKRYGLLAGRFVAAPIWNDVRQTVGARYQPFGELYATILRAWKASKTALSPSVHMNNVMANIVMADWHDVHVADLLRALEVLVKAGKDPAYRVILDRFEDAGGGGGMFAVSELQREQLEPLLDALRQEYGLAGQATGMTGISAALHLLLQRQWRAAFEAASAGRSAGAARRARW